MKITRVGGGGCCDCGDESSWDSQGFCSMHSGHLKASQSIENLSSVIGEDNANFSRSVLCAVLNIVFFSMAETSDHYLISETVERHVMQEMRRQLANISHFHNIFILLVKQSSDTLVLIEQLRRRIGFNLEEASDVVQKIEAFGSSLVYCSTNEESASRIHKDLIDTEIDCEIIVSDKAFLLSCSRASVLIDWLSFMCSFSDSIIQALCEGFICNIDTISRKEERRIDLLDLWMLCGAFIPSSVAESLHNFCFKIFTNASFKETFTKRILSMYDVLLDQNSDQMAPRGSPLIYTVQLFTIPQLSIKLMMENPCAFDIICSSFSKRISELIDPNTHELIAERFGPFHRDVPGFFWQCLHDLKYLLKTKGVLDLIYSYRPECFEKWLNLLCIVEQMDPLKRQSIGHVEYENITWQAALDMETLLFRISNLFFRGLDETFANLDPLQVNQFQSILSQSWRSILTNIDNSSSKLSMLPLDSKSLLSDPTSIHLPARRSLFAILVRLSKYTNLSPCAILDTTAQEFLLFADASFLALVTSCHVSAQLWRRNGLSMLNIFANYKYVIFYDRSYRLDLLGLQLTLCVINADEFLSHLLHRFLLHDCFTLNEFGVNNFLPLGVFSSWDSEQQASVIEGFLQLLIEIMIERSLLTSSTRLEVVKYELIQWLTISDFSFSDLKDLVGEKDVELLTSALETVSHFSNPHNLDQGKYSLNLKFLPWFDPHFTKFSCASRMETDAQSSYSIKSQKLRKRIFHNPNEYKEISLDSLEMYPPISKLLPLTPLFSNILNTLGSRIMQIIWLDILTEKVKTSENCVHLVLRMISIGLSDWNHLSGPVREGFISNLRDHNSHYDDSILECLCRLLLADIDKKEHSSYLRKLIEDISVLDELCYKITKPFLDEAFRVADSSRKINLWSRRAKRAKATILRKFDDKRRSFISKNSELLNIHAKDRSNIQGISPEKMYKSGIVVEESHECIVCRSHADLDKIGLLGWTSPSYSEIGLAFPVDRRCSMSSAGLYIKLCGHGLHFSCFSAYSGVQLVKEASGQYYEGYQAIDLKNGEFICPFCKSPSNIVVPQYQTIEVQNSIQFFEKFRLNSYDSLGLNPVLIPSGNARDSIYYFSQTLQQYSKLVSWDSIVWNDLNLVSKIHLEMLVSSIQNVEKGQRNNNSLLLSSLSKKDILHLRYLLRASVGSILIDSSNGFQSLLSCMRQTCFSEIDSAEDPFRALLLGCVVLLSFISIEASNSSNFLGIGCEMSDTYGKILKEMFLHFYKAELSQNASLLLSLNRNDLRDARFESLLLQWREIQSDSGSVGKIEFACHKMNKSALLRLVLPFLRLSSILAIVIGYPDTDIISLPEKSSWEGNLYEAETSRLLKMLGLPSVKHILDKERSSPSILLDSIKLVESFQKKQVPCFYSNIRLVALPRKYDSVVQMSLKASCYLCKNQDPEQPFCMCLICGQIMCFKNENCLEERNGSPIGTLSYHSAAKPSKIGVFLRLDRSNVILHRDGFSIDFASPYLDKYGEEDIGLIRGLPLILNDERYQAIQQIFASESIAHQVCRKRAYQALSSNLPNRNRW